MGFGVAGDPPGPSLPDGASATVPSPNFFAKGYPQCGHVGANVLTRPLHSGQLIKAILVSSLTGDPYWRQL
jgi:hypothetical protein